MSFKAKTKAKTFKEFFLTSLFPVHILVFLDFLMTFFGQPKDFWDSGLKSMNESNPFVDLVVEFFGYFGLAIAFFGWVFGYSLFIFYASKIVSKFLKIDLQLVVFYAILCFWFGHVFGFLSWVGVIFRETVHEYYYWWLIIGSLAVLNILVIFIYSKLKLIQVDEQGKISINFI